MSHFWLSHILVYHNYFTWAKELHFLCKALDQHSLEVILGAPLTRQVLKK